MPRHATRPRPSALKHGLTSRLARDEASEEVDALARAVLGSSPAEPPLTDAARAVADAAIHLRRVRQARHTLLNEATRSLAFDVIGERITLSRLREIAQAEGAADGEAYFAWRLSLAGPTADADDQERGELALADCLSAHSKALDRLANYERRALSLLRGALRVLDYEQTEAARGHRGSKRSAVA